jgi:hypothetical protein
MLDDAISASQRAVEQQKAGEMHSKPSTVAGVG